MKAGKVFFSFNFEPLLEKPTWPYFWGNMLPTFFLIVPLKVSKQFKTLTNYVDTNLFSHNQPLLDRGVKEFSYVVTSRTTKANEKEQVLASSNCIPCHKILQNAQITDINQI